MGNLSEMRALIEATRASDDETTNALEEIRTSLGKIDYARERLRRYSTLDKTQKAKLDKLAKSLDNFGSYIDQLHKQISK